MVSSKAGGRGGKRINPRDKTVKTFLIKIAGAFPKIRSKRRVQILIAITLGKQRKIRRENTCGMVVRFFEGITRMSILAIVKSYRALEKKIRQIAKIAIKRIVAVDLVKIIEVLLEVANRIANVFINVLEKVPRRSVRRIVWSCADKLLGARDSRKCMLVARREIVPKV